MRELLCSRTENKYFKGSYFLSWRFLNAVVRKYNNECINLLG